MVNQLAKLSKKSVVFGLLCVVVGIIALTILKENMWRMASNVSEKNVTIQATGDNETDQLSEKNAFDDILIPTIVITSPIKEIGGFTYTQANMKIYGADFEANGSSNELLFESRIGIKMRGKSSRSYPKKQYRIESWDKNNEDKNAKILDLPKDSDWVLAAPFKDKSLIRNKLVFDVASEIMGYAPRSRFCEVYVTENSREMNEWSYKGLYLLTENIKRAEDRVNVFPTYEGRSETSFIVNKDVPRDDDVLVNTYGKETLYYPKALEVVAPMGTHSKDQLTYISRYLSKTERILLSSGYDERDGGYSDYLDMNSFIDYYLINEFFKNTDGGVYSTFMYKDYGEKIKIGPVWDFNESLGNNSDFGDLYEPEGFYINTHFWFDRLMDDRHFVSKVIERYEELRESYLSDAYLHAEIDKNVALTEQARKSNYERWPWDICNQAEKFEYTFIGLLGRSSDELKAKEYYLSENLLGYIDRNKNKEGNTEKIYEMLSTVDRLYESDQLIDIEGREQIEVYEQIFNSDLNYARNYDDEIVKMKAFITDRGEWMDNNIDQLLKFTE